MDLQRNKMTKLTESFNELIILQKEREVYKTKADNIQKTSPYCQLPSPFHEALDKAVKIGNKQAKIWNEIRGFILKDNKTTIWQFSIKKNFPIRNFGQESFFKLTSKHLNLIQVELK